MLDRLRGSRVLELECDKNTSPKSSSFLRFRMRRSAILNLHQFYLVFSWLWFPLLEDNAAGGDIICLRLHL